MGNFSGFFFFYKPHNTSAFSIRGDTLPSSASTSASHHLRNFQTVKSAAWMHRVSQRSHLRCFLSARRRAPAHAEMHLCPLCVDVHACAPCTHIACSWLCARATVEILGDTAVWHCQLQWRLLIRQWPFHRREGTFVWRIARCVSSLSLQRLRSIKHTVASSNQLILQTEMFGFISKQLLRGALSPLLLNTPTFVLSFAPGVGL